MKVIKILDDCSYTRIALLKERIEENFSKSHKIVIVSCFIKMKEIQDMLHGDIYINSRISVIHPKDKRVTTLKGGMVNIEDFKEYMDNYDNETKTKLFFDMLNSSHSEMYARFFRDKKNIEYIAYTSPVSKDKYAIKAFFKNRQEHSYD